MRDPGLQAERTALAWRRTALAVLVAGTLLLKVVLATHLDWLIGLGCLLCPFALLTGIVTRQRSKHLLALPYQHRSAHTSIRTAALFALSTSIAASAYCMATLAAG